MILGFVFLFFVIVCSFIFIIISTNGDVKTFRDKKNCKKVAVNITQSMSDEKIRSLFLKQNVWEMQFFWCGVAAGILIAWMIFGGVF